MELNIKNFASIKEASIKIDGITVIAGENNTGKSTIGKILFASFNSLRDIDKEVRLNILNSINRQWDNFVLDLITMHKTDMDISILYDILSNILNVEDEDIEKIISNNVGEYIDINDKFIIEAIKSTANRIKEYKNISKEKLSYNIISKYYNDLFYKQINSRIFKNTNAEIEINDFGILLEFKDDKCIKFKKNIYDNNVFLIDNPFVLDKIYSSYSSSITDLYLIDKIRHIYNKDYIVDKTLVEEKLEIIYKMLSNAINGKIIKKENDFYLAFDNITEPISIHNISAGLKSFTIIKMMLEEGILKEKDILVLDEPEIHLHPQWQLLYAEIIVLIQKVFNLHIVITTHSPYFLESIELFTKKHDHGFKNRIYQINKKIKIGIDGNPSSYNL